MKNRPVIVALAAIAVAITSAIAVFQYASAGNARQDLPGAEFRRQSLREHVADLERKVAAAEMRATEAERDSAELLRSIHAVRDQRAATAIARAADPVARPSFDPGVGPSMSFAESEHRQFGTGSTLRGMNRSLPEDEQHRLLVERAYQQGMAKARARQAKERAELDEAVLHLDPAAKFAHRVAAAARLEAQDEFAEANSVLTQALAEKPVDVPLSPQVEQLRAELQAQSTPMPVTLVSDEQTVVTVTALRGPRTFSSDTITLLPGDYQFVGRRQGFKDVSVLLELRNGVPPPLVTVMCTEPAAP